MRRAVGIVVAALAMVAACSTPQAPLAEPPPREPSPDPADPDRRARARLELAAAYFGRGQAETALQEVKLALAAKSDLPAAYNLQGLIYAALGDEQQAEDSYRRALQLNPRDGDTLHNYGWLLCQQKRYADADAQYRQALALPQYANTARTLTAQGICHARAGDFERAEVALSRSYELDATNPATAVNLAEVLLRRGEYERARFYVRRVNSQPDLSNAQTLWLAARIEHKLGNDNGVATFGKQLRDRFPQSREALALQRGAFDE
jgi:type IV pilus assembly protein PilF